MTGGGTKNGAVAAHLAYISRKGELAIETDEGDRAAGRDAQIGAAERLASRPIGWPVSQPQRRTCDCSGNKAGPQHRALDAVPDASG